MLRICKYCGKKFNGWVKLYDHKIADEPKWRAKAKRYFTRQIQVLRQSKK